MLIGEFEHSVDQKGRVIIPARFREDLGDKFVITKGPDECLFIYSLHEWARLERQIKELPLSKSRSLQLYFFSSGNLCETDKQGRALVPQNLRRFAKLEKTVMVIGASNHVELWDSELWQEKCRSLTPDMIVAAMEEMGF
ncbi:MAG: division/cell wall cluster transcriptional repressor MraZ [Clostridia bacterium]|nr:division/cell wall cluster transcriptional repressor MraZ [Clostridia bacterium]